MSKTGANFLDSLVRDENMQPVQVGSEFITEDGTSGTTLKSPLSYSGTTQITIVVPDRACEFIANPSTALWISAVSGTTKYDVIAASTKEAIPCARMANIYVIGGTQSGVLNFRFTLV